MEKNYDIFIKDPKSKQWTLIGKTIGSLKFELIKTDGYSVSEIKCKTKKAMKDLYEMILKQKYIKLASIFQDWENLKTLICIKE